MTQQWNNSEEKSAFGFNQSSDDWLEKLQNSTLPSSADTVGDYRILEEIRSGAQGIVYRAIDTRNGQIVALKRLRRGSFSTDRARQRLEREMKIVADLSHPGIVSLHRLLERADNPILVFEWIDGVCPTDWIQQYIPRFKIRESLKLMRRICAAAHHAHQRGVIHRDLKPSNILVDENGQPHILDFGIASFILQDLDDSTHITQTLEFVGTPAYAPPEYLISGSRTADIRGDIYSLGVLLFELLTGELPRPAPSTLEQSLEAIQNPPKKPSSCATGIPADLDQIVLKAISSDADMRYSSMESFSADIQRFLDGLPVEAHPPSTWYRIRRSVQRNGPLYLVGLTAIVTVAIFGTYSWQQHLESERQRSSAEDTLQFSQEIFLALHSVPFDVQRDPKESLRAASALILNRFPGQPKDQASLYSLVGESQIGVGDYRSAIESLLLADSILQGLDKDKSEIGIRVHAQLAHSYLLSGDYDHAEKWLQLTEDEQIDFDPSMATDLARTQTAIVELLSIRGRYPEAREKLSEIKQKHIELHGINSPQVQEDDLQAAKLMSSAGEFQEAEILQRKILAQRLSQLDPNSLNVLHARRELASTLLQAGHFVNAEQEYRTALRSCRNLLPVGHPLTAGILSDLGNLLVFSNSNLTEAESLLEESISIFRSSDLPDHLAAGVALSGLATLSSIQQKPQQAESLFQESLTTLRNKVGAHHPAVADCLAASAANLIRAERSDEALVLIQEGYDIIAEVLGPQHYLLAQYLDLFASAYSRLEQIPEALAAYKRAIALVKATNPTDFHLFFIYSNMGAMHLRRGDTALAKAAYGSALDICRENELDIGNPDYSHCVFLMALCDFRVEDFPSALKGCQQITNAVETYSPPPSTVLLAQGLAAAIRFQEKHDPQDLLQVENAVNAMRESFSNNYFLPILEENLRHCQDLMQHQ